MLIWARYITQIYERPQNQLLPIVHLRLPYRETRELALVNAFGVTRRGLFGNENSIFECDDSSIRAEFLVKMDVSTFRQLLPSSTYIAAT